MSDERLGALATELRRRGLDAPALLLLHAHRPLRPMLGQLAVFISPVSRSLRGPGRALLDSLGDDQRYDELIHALEAEDER